MSQIEILSCEQALRALGEGEVVRMAEQPILVRQKEDKLLTLHPNWHAALSVPEFRALFPTMHFRVVAQEDGIDEAKDADYYAWRSKYL
ncbi:hypothetical protein [uncultured Dubosiella sp.]|uniref:hypothetical protein n=1 Tax=uncultured Dubosiella sp. TaxID=1937011 RepID=UPI0025945997|nr:hypothetical protein [uncultured Dubosiella sp.]